jgi:hypothetical protein
MQEYHRIGKAIGPGGIRCPCCNRHHSGRSQASTKRAINQFNRRKSKREVSYEKEE